MKHLLFSIIIIISFGVNAQIHGLQDYKHWNRKDSIDFGVKGFIYTDSNPYLKHYWYAERLNKEGFKLIRSELSRLLILNQSDINKPNFLDLDDSYEMDLSNFKLLHRTVSEEGKEISAYWEIKDIHNVVNERWIISFDIDEAGMTIYVFSRYGFFLENLQKVHINSSTK